MFVCVPVHMCVSKHACGGQKSASSVIPQDPFTFIKNDPLLCVHEYTLVCIVWRSEDNLQEFTLSFYYADPRDQTHIVQLDSRYLDPWAIFSDPHFVFWDKVSL